MMVTEMLPLAVDPSLLGRLEPVRALSLPRLNELSTLCVSETVGRGHDPFRVSGLPGQSAYLVSGELKLSYADGSSFVMVGGSESSCWPLACRPPPILSAKAITDVGLIRIDDEMLDIMMTWDQLSDTAGYRAHSLAETGETSGWPMPGPFRLQNLREGVLSRLPPANIEMLFGRLERIPVQAGAVIVREGDEGDYYYLIESGRCAVLRIVGGAELKLAELKPGDAFGEEALVAESTRNATVRMKTDGVLLRLGKEDFNVLLREPLLHRLSHATASQQVAAGALWLDVRYPAEYRNHALPGAVNIPLSEIRNAIGVLDREAEYVVYCQSGRRSSAAAFLLSQNGYRAGWLDGGWQEFTPSLNR